MQNHTVIHSNTISDQISALMFQNMSEKEFINVDDSYFKNFDDDEYEIYFVERRRRLDEVIKALAQNVTAKNTDALDAVTRFLNFSEQFGFCFYFFADVINMIGGVEATCDLATNLDDRITPNGIQGIDIPDLPAFYIKHKKNIIAMLEFINKLSDERTEKNSILNDKSIIMLIKTNNLMPDGLELKVDDIAKVIYGNKNGKTVANYENIMKSAILFVIYSTLVNLQDFVEDKTLV